MNATQLKAKIEHAQERLLAAESEMEKALQHVGNAPRADKSIISTALSAAFEQLKAAKRDLGDLERAIAEGE
jgi:hypothetical protein